MKLPRGTLVVTRDDFTGRVQKILTENLRVVQFLDHVDMRFLIREFRVAELREANDHEAAKFKQNSVEHNRRLAETVAAQFKPRQHNKVWAR